MIRKLMQLWLVTCVFTVFANGQQRGGGGNQPAPAPVPTPQPGTNRPTVTPQPTPTPSPTQNLVLTGRLIADPGFDFPIVEVRFEYDGGQPIGFAYANSSGEFTFQSPAIQLDQNIYVVVNVEGYKQVRQRLDGLGPNGFGGLLNIFLERENIVRISKSGAAIVDVKQLRAHVPGKAVDEYEKALKDSSKGNSSSAVERLERAIKLAPDFYEAQNTLGIQYLKLQKYEDAEAALLRAKDLSPKAADPLINLGLLYYQRGETLADSGKPEDAATTFQKATQFLEESVQRSPLSSLANSYLGAALYKTGAYERAETTLNKALELDDQQHDARLMLINVYVKQTRYEEAIAQIKTYIAKNPKAPQRAALERIQGQIEKTK
jgi:Flp pilus assembly protein TadD